MKRCENKLGGQGLPTIDEINFYNDDDEVAKHSLMFMAFCA